MGKAFILMAEDHPDTRAALSSLLISEGFNVVPVEDGEKALTFLSNVRPDLILTDLMMPRLDGLELIRRARSDRHYAQTPIVAFTAYGDDCLQQAKAAGATAVLHKPDDLLKVVDTLKEFLTKEKGITEV